MNRLLMFIILLGVATGGYFGWQWVAGSAGAEHVPASESKDWGSVTTKAADTPLPTSAVDEKPKMSEDIDLFEAGEEAARLVIPDIETAYTVYWGADDRTLKQGVGMYVSEWTTAPDAQRHTVLSGHRDTVFTELGSLDQQDLLYLEYEGLRYEYEIDQMWITDADDRTVIVDTDEPTLTLTTCYPFDFIGSAPDRYIIQASLTFVEEID